MRSLLRSIRQFLSELRRRNVYQVAVTYVVVGFFVIEGADLTLTRLGLPGWTVTLVIVLVGLGFPIALVMAWALEVTPEGVRIEETVAEETDDSEAVPAPVATTPGLWVGASVLVLLLLGVWWLWGGLGSGSAAEKTENRTPEVNERSITVLPFEVSGRATEEWQNGMVTALSLNLDGAAGLRAIPDRRIFAVAEQIDSSRIGPAGSPALATARRTGAKYAVIGSAVQLASDLRFGATIRAVRSGERLGQVEVRGSPDSITALTDDLTRQILGVLLEKSEEQVPSVDLANITTSSLSALKAFLDGERHFRESEYTSAVEDYETAITADSSFALAYHRLHNARFWAGESGVMRASRQAFEHSDRLPRRERRLVRATYLWAPQNRSKAAADSLRRLTNAYPDDPSVWYWFGEVLYHGHVPRGLPEAEKAFTRALHLDPGLAPYHHHHVELAFALHRDSSLAAERIRSHPSGSHKQMYRVAMDLVFGSPDTQERALARVDSIPRNTVKQLFNALRHPAEDAIRTKALSRVVERPTLSNEERDQTRTVILIGLLKKGQIDDAVSRLENGQLDTPFTTRILTYSKTLALPTPDSLLHAPLDPRTRRDAPSPRSFMAAGIYLLKEGREDEVSAVLQRLRSVGVKRGLSEAQIQELVDEVKGYRAWQAGDLKRAVAYWENSNQASVWGGIWRGDLYRALGQLQKAQGWYQGAWRHPLAHERLGQLYEEMGKPEKAAAAYQRFIAAWKNADPALQPRVETARRRLEALGDPAAAE